MASGQTAQPKQQQAHSGNGRVDDGGLTGRHDFHLLVADAAIPECSEVFQTWVALCGRKLSARELPSSMCPPDCQREVTYCPECLRSAIKRNDTAGAVSEVLGAPAAAYPGDGGASSAVGKS